MIRSKRRSELILNVVTYAIVIGVVIFALFPLVWTFLTSIKIESDIVTSTLQYIPQRATFANYVAIWRRSGFPTLILNSAVVTSITVVICLFIGTLAAYGFSRYRFRGRSGLLLFYLVIRMFPVVLMIIPLFIMMRNLGLLDSRFGLALAYTTFLLPLCVWLLKGFFDAIPVDLEDSARIDGCTRFGALFRIVLPLARLGAGGHGRLYRHCRLERVPLCPDADNKPGLAYLAGRFAAYGGRIPTALGRPQCGWHHQYHSRHYLLFHCPAVSDSGPDRRRREGIAVGRLRWCCLSSRRSSFCVLGFSFVPF